MTARAAPARPAARAGSVPVSDVADPGVAVAVPHADSVAFVAKEMRGGAGGSYFVCAVEGGPRGRRGGKKGPHLVAVDNLEVLYAAREAGAERVEVRLVGNKGGGAGGGGGGDGALREHLTRASLHATIDPFAAAEAVGRLRRMGASAGGEGDGGDGGRGGGACPAYLGPYLERAASLGFAGRPREALSDMVRRVYACGVRQAPPLPFLISVSRLDADAQVAVADMTARLCEAVRQRHFAWPGADVIRLLLQGAGMEPGPDGGRPRAGAARLPPTFRQAPPDAAAEPAAGGAGGGGGGAEGAPPRGGRSAGPAGPAATESRAARLSMFYCSGCKRRYCVLRGGVREVSEGRDGCYVVSPGPAEDGGGEGAGNGGGGRPAAEVIHALPSAQREYLGLDDDSSLRVVRAAGAEALRKKADDLGRQGRDGPFVVLYAADRGRRPSGRGRKRRIRA